MPRSFNSHGITLTSGEETATQFVGTYGFGWELGDHIRWNSAIRYGTAGDVDDRFLFLAKVGVSLRLTWRAKRRFDLGAQGCRS